MAEQPQLQRVWPLHPTSCLEGPALGGDGEGLGSGWCDTPLSPPEMLSDSEEEDRVSSTTTSYDYRESRALGPAGVGAPGLGGGVERFQAPGTRLQTSLPSHRTRLSCGPVHLPSTRPRCFLLPRVGSAGGSRGALLEAEPARLLPLPALFPRGRVPAAAFLPGDHSSDPGPGPQPPGLQEVEEQAGVLEGP